MLNQVPRRNLADGQRRTRVGRALFGLGAVLVLSLACSLGGGSSASRPETDGPSAPSPAPSETAQNLPDETFTINHAFWHSGFRVELEQGRFYAEQDELTQEISYFVSLGNSYENLGNHDTFFDAAVSLTWPGNSAPMLLNSERPSVPAGLSSSGEFRFRVDESFEIDQAMLVVGSPDVNQAQLPLGEQGGEPVTLEPIELNLSGMISLDLIDLTFKGGDLRADRLTSYTEFADGKRGLTLYFDVTSRKGGNWTINPQDFALTQPNGTAVGPDDAQFASLPGSDAGTVTTDLWIRFPIDSPAQGSYLLRFSPGSWFLEPGGVSEGTWEFSLP